MGRRNEHTREEQRDMAVAAAEHILVKDGVAALSMRKVADAIGYTVGNLYLLFENQDDLLATINERTTDAIYAYLTDAAAASDDPSRRLQKMAVAYVEFAQKYPHRWRLMFEHQLPPAMVPRASADQRIQRMFELVESALKPVMAGATARKLRTTATALWSGVHGVATLAVTGKLKWSGLSHYGALCEELIVDCLAGIAARRPRRSNRS
jgi:AcrR family transcriptional regulator